MMKKVYLGANILCPVPFAAVALYNLEHLAEAALAEDTWRLTHQLTHSPTYLLTYLHTYLLTWPRTRSGLKCGIESTALSFACH